MSGRNERELLEKIAEHATTLAGGTMSGRLLRNERELLAEIEYQMRTLAEGGVPLGTNLNAGEVPKWDGSAWVGAQAVEIDSWDINFLSDGDGYFRAYEAMTVALGDEIGTGTLSYAKSSAAAPSTFNATTLPDTLEAGAFLKVSALGVSGYKAAQIVRTA